MVHDEVIAEEKETQLKTKKKISSRYLFTFYYFYMFCFRECTIQQNNILFAICLINFTVRLFVKNKRGAGFQFNKQNPFVRLFL